MTTVPIFKDCMAIIMEFSPKDFNSKDLLNEILKLKTVQEVHDFHCWSLAGGKHIMTCHVRSQFGDRVIRDINRICKRDEYGVFHTTIQVERDRHDVQRLTCDHNN